MKETHECWVENSERPFDKRYWQTQWESEKTAWDIGHAAPAITDYMRQYTDKNASILIPGCGNAYEAEYLVEIGFTNITLIDIAPKAVELLENRFLDVEQVNILCEDFFLHQGNYDLLIEQTFFCAIHPKRRSEYIEKAASLLKKDGRIIGVLFDKIFGTDGPPFGAKLEEYKPLFAPYFELKKLEGCYNSIKQRENSEVFINFLKKQTT